MTEAELRRLIAELEGEAVEFKPALLSRREMAEYAVGIGNAGGGWLLMRVSDKPPRQIIPLEVPPKRELDRIRDSIENAAQVHVQLEVVQTQEGALLAVRVPRRPRGGRRVDGHGSAWRAQVPDSRFRDGSRRAVRCGRQDRRHDGILVHVQAYDCDTIIHELVPPCPVWIGSPRSNSRYTELLGYWLVHSIYKSPEFDITKLPEPRKILAITDISMTKFSGDHD